MRAEYDELHAAIVLRLLLKSTHGLLEMSEIKWDGFLQLAKRNVVLLRVADRLKKIGFQPPTFFLDAVENERQLVLEKIELIRQISQVCSENGIEFMFAKAFQHYPDMGDDIDLFVSSHSVKVDELIIKALRASPEKRDFCNWVAATANYRVKGCQSPIEIHHGRLGILGEDVSHLAALIKNGKWIDIEGSEFLVPSAEDQLILQSMQKVYGRLHIRLSDIVYTVSSIRRDCLDWGYIIHTAKRLGTFHGLCCYLTYIDQICHNLFDSSSLSSELKETLILNGWGQMKFRSGFYMFPRVRVVSRIYTRKFQTALLSGNWESAGRLCLLPLIAAVTAMRRLKRIPIGNANSGIS